MVNRPSVPEIITVNSEALQTQIRDLLPSQNGFGSELQASNVITPVIDLTRAAEGSTTPEILQTALAFGSQTAFEVTNTTTVLANIPGFYRIFGVVTQPTSASVATAGSFTLSDGVSTKTIWKQSTPAIYANVWINIDFDFVVFLAAGESLSAISTNASLVMAGSTRQIATGDGTLVPPNGFPV